MARKKVREYDSKRLLKAHIARLAGLQLPLNVAQVRSNTDYVELLDKNPWLNSTKLVVKPDMLFGKRGKHDLVGLNLDFSGVEEFIKARMGRIVDMDGCKGAINTFVVEPFVPHDQEYYLCIQSHRLGMLPLPIGAPRCGLGACYELGISLPATSWHRTIPPHQRLPPFAGRPTAMLPPSQQPITHCR